RHRRDEPRELRRDALRHVVEHGVPRQIHVLGEAAPQVWRPLVGGIAVAYGVGIGAPVGVLAVAVLAGVAPLALAAAHVVLHEDEITLPETLAIRELPACLRDVADVLVAHDRGLVVLREGLELLIIA